MKTQAKNTRKIAIMFSMLLLASLTAYFAPLDQTAGGITICHCPPGNPQNNSTIMVSSGAAMAHLAHGDMMGECPELDPHDTFDKE